MHWFQKSKTCQILWRTSYLMNCWMQMHRKVTVLLYLCHYSLCIALWQIRNYVVLDLIIQYMTRHAGIKSELHHHIKTDFIVVCLPHPSRLRTLKQFKLLDYLLCVSNWSVQWAQLSLIFWSNGKSQCIVYRKYSLMFLKRFLKMKMMVAVKIYQADVSVKW